jgi:nucleoside-diphosphate-sugar epimerase
LRSGAAGLDVAAIDIHDDRNALLAGLRESRVVFHLAGVNRPPHDSEFITGNVGSLEAVLAAIDESLENARKTRPLIVLASSTQAGLDNPYGRSKLAAEQLLDAYVTRTGSSAVIYRLPGVFGKWCRPNYNSVVATFCHNIARDLPIVISDPNHLVELVHVDGRRRTVHDARRRRRARRHYARGRQSCFYHQRRRAGRADQDVSRHAGHASGGRCGRSVDAPIARPLIRRTSRWTIWPIRSRNARTPAARWRSS